MCKPEKNESIPQELYNFKKYELNMSITYCKIYGYTGFAVRFDHSNLL